jgi:hypothetical protein
MSPIYRLLGFILNFCPIEEIFPLFCDYDWKYMSLVNIYEKDLSSKNAIFICKMGGYKDSKHRPLKISQNK